MILVDTSIWIDHLHKANLILVAALDAEQIWLHPFVYGELACGNIQNRADFLHTISSLPRPHLATDEETLAFLEEHQLMGKGLGYIDIHLLASTALTKDSLVWSRDKRLASVASRLELGYVP